MASTISKPDGLLIVAEADTQRFLAARSVRALWGVGPKAAEALESRGLRTVADVLDAPTSVLEHALGSAMAHRVWHLSRGIDPREVTTERVEKSVGHEETFGEDIDDPRVLRSEFRRLADRVAARLRSHGWEAGVVAVKVRLSDFTTLSRSQTLAEPTSVGQRIGETAIELFETVARDLPVRLIGVRGEKLRSSGSGALALWDDESRWCRAVASAGRPPARTLIGICPRGSDAGSVDDMPNIALELGKQSAAFGVNSAYGEQQDVDGVRIVPVALSWSGFGGGSDDAGNGGGGGGGYAIPLGAYIRRGDDLRFEPNIVSLLAVAIPFVWVAGRSLSRVIRILKK